MDMDIGSSSATSPTPMTAPLRRPSKSSPVHSSLTSPIAVPTHGPSGTFSVFTSTRINARPEAALRATLDHGAYPRWNSFTPTVVIDSHPGGVDLVPLLALPARNGNGNENSNSAVFCPGTRFTLTACLTRPPPHLQAFTVRSGVRLEVTHVEALGESKSDEPTWSGYRVAWKIIGYPPWMLRSERVQEFVLEGGMAGAEDGGDRAVTEYRCWETFGGVGAWFVRLCVGELLRRRFAECAEDLKTWCEGGGGRSERD